ncbi:LexA family protein [Streptomyces sp. NPDC021100]|uniref:LexA family protein n=1 Tax=Streptomyces sp. NPDC021100 TaxID=3365114 RepID=UPI0037A6B1E3
MTTPWVLSHRQVAILCTIRESIAEHGEAPTIREIADQVGLSSTGTVAYHLDRLEERGLISRERRWRSVRLGS